MAQHGHSEACCTVPPIQHDYKEKGSYIEIEVDAGKKMRTYRTGKADAKTGIVIVYDIFGFSPQGLQGADILSQEHQVFIPDFFYGKPYPKSLFPPDNEEKKKAFGEFFGGPAEPGATKAKMPAIIDELTKVSGVQKWGALGQCWGGKIVSLSSGEGTKYSVAGSTHPAMVEPEEAKAIKIPFVMLGSQDETQESLDGFKANLTAPNHVERFNDQVHGWMAARADLKDERVVEEYRRGYQVLLDFYHKHL